MWEKRKQYYFYPLLPSFLFVSSVSSVSLSVSLSVFPPVPYLNPRPALRLEHLDHVAAAANHQTHTVVRDDDLHAPVPAPPHSAAPHAAPDPRLPHDRPRVTRGQDHTRVARDTSLGKGRGGVGERVGMGRVCVCARCV